MVNETQATTTSFTPADEYVISDLETVKILADPLRLKIVEYLRRPATVKEIAAKLNKPPTKLYYHFNLLEKHNLIQMVFTRIVSGIVEKHYQAAAKTYRMERNLLSPGHEEFDERFDYTISSVLNSVRADLRESILAGVVDTTDEAPAHRRLFMLQGRMSLSPKHAEVFYKRLYDLLCEFDESADDEQQNAPGDVPPELQSYKITLLLHPAEHTASDDDDDQADHQYDDYGDEPSD